jgi:GNAT superfamily N-acetyltransferase
MTQPVASRILAVTINLKVRIKLQIVTPDQAAAIASLRATVAEKLTAQFGNGPWSSAGTEKGVRFDMRNSAVYAAMHRNKLIASLRLDTKKPWAIDKKYFSKCQQPLYLLSMAVRPDLQRTGIGRLCIDKVKRIAKKFPSDAIRLDAYDAAAGAGEFYRKCGFREVGRATFRNCPLIYFEILL